VTNMLKDKGIDKREIGREEFLKHCWEWRDEYGRTIINQLKKLGSSADWERERFTMDEGCSDAVEEVFVRLYEKGYIYKGSRIINWCPVCQTSLSDAEVEHEDQDGFFWHINYPIVGEEGRFVEIATTRPETLLGDTAVAVNPEDERYQDIIGKELALPLTDRTIPVIADSYVDKEFGTGCVKITPAHDPNDFEVGKRHDLEEINILNDDATMNSKCGKYAGMDRYEARKAMVKDLEDLGLLVKVVPHSHAVGTHDRCHTTVEPMIKPQWFVRMKEMGKAALDALHNKDLTFVPENYGKTYEHWLSDIKDWCISRQLWWGHRMPVYYCDECGEFVVQRGGAPDVCPKCGCTHFTQESDTLDTWFSSALWPFSTLGWPNKTEEMDYFYPTDVLVTGYDIIFFWVIRMMFSGIEQTGKSPFHHVLIHGLVRDDKGRKMSKSLGNGIDPLEVIDQYGADALRLTLMTGNAPGNDMRFYMERVENSRNFANKIWNASRFIQMNLEGFELTKPADEDLKTEDRWIISLVNTLAKDVTENMDKYELGIAVSKVYDFIWEEFCDWYIEIVKPRMYNREEDKVSANAALYTLKTVLSDALKLLHPFMPFITEEIFCSLNPDAPSIMIAQWPEFAEEKKDLQAENILSRAKDLVRGMRTVRKDMNVPPSKKATLIITSSDEKVRKLFAENTGIYAGLAGAGEVKVQEGTEGVDETAVSFIIPDTTVYIPLNELVDLAKEKERLLKEQKRLEGELKRSRAMLSNEKFLSKAPEAKVAEEKEKLAQYEQMMADVSARLEQM
ncbi:MAG: valine--tRNA ligase, partial [Lachnospiraceae bacterium]|nr:valine--tRNA ligase [Lachnospiraceae bacterium]